MLEVKNLVKKFDEKVVLDNINYSFEKGKIYGLVGINGAGKSTLLRTMSGIYKGTTGEVTYNGENVYDSKLAKANIFYFPDENYSIIQPTIEKYIKFYEKVYGERKQERYEKLKEFFDLDINAKIVKFSKGMKKQALLFIFLCFDMEYLLLDETFEGIDPVIKSKITRLLLEEVEDRGLVLIISSHNINELETMCDEILLLNKNKLEHNEAERENMYKVQVGFKEQVSFDGNENVKILKTEQRGSVYSLIVCGEYEDISEYFESLHPAILDVFSLSAEEMMIYKVETGKFES